MEHNTEREGVGRRAGDFECQEHEKRVNLMDAELSKQSGWLKASALLVLIAMAVIGGLSNLILNKLTSIETLLSDSKVTMMKHEMSINSLDVRVKSIESRHLFIDQNAQAKR